MVNSGEQWLTRILQGSMVRNTRICWLILANTGLMVANSIFLQFNSNGSTYNGRILWQVYPSMGIYLTITTNHGIRHHCHRQFTNHSQPSITIIRGMLYLVGNGQWLLMINTGSAANNGWWFSSKYPLGDTGE